MKRIICILLSAFIILLCGCQPAPEQEFVVSKHENPAGYTENESVSENDSTRHATNTGEQDESTVFAHRFSSTDQSVNFTVAIPEVSWDFKIPIVEVEPYYITGQDVERVTRILFGDSFCHEYDRFGQEIFTRDELGRKIQRITEYKGSIANGMTISDEFRSKQIRKCTELMENAPLEESHSPCEWEFRPGGYYTWSDEEMAEMGNEQLADELMVRVVNGEVPYTVFAGTKNGSDFKYNGISVSLSAEGQYGYDKYYFANQFCQTEKPDETDIESAEIRAEQLLNNMELGKWIVDSSYVHEICHNLGNEYIITVRALPSFGDVPTLRRPQPLNLKSKDIYAANYWLSEAEFEFAKGGELISFHLGSPLSSPKIIDDNVRIFSQEALVNRAVQMLSLTDAHHYDYVRLLEDGGDYQCEVYLSRMELGLSRVRVPNKDATYQYTPTVVFFGKIVFTDPDSDRVYHMEDSISGDEFSLLVLNAMDGSVINDVNS